MANEFDRLEQFAQKHRLNTRRDDCNETIIPGRQGQIYQYDDKMLGVMFMPPPTKEEPWGKWMPRTWTNFKQLGEVTGMIRLQNGSSEGCLAFDPENKVQVKLAIKIAKVRVRRAPTLSDLANLAKGRRYRFKSVSDGGSRALKAHFSDRK